MNRKATAIAALVGLGLLVWWLTSKAPFKVGDNVREKADHFMTGIVDAVYKDTHGNWLIDVTFHTDIKEIGLDASLYEYNVLPASRY